MQLSKPTWEKSMYETQVSMIGCETNHVRVWSIEQKCGGPGHQFINSYLIMEKGMVKVTLYRHNTDYHVNIK